MFHVNEQRSVTARRETTITGNRPTPLKINGDSHRIRKQRHHQPVIIYVHSPKVIHTRPHDFMALVQKLTGLTRSDGEEKHDETHNESSSRETLNALQGGYPKDDSQIQNQNHEHRYFSDVPMFTPSSVDYNNLLCSPSSLCGSISPSMFKFIQGLPEY